MTLYEQILLELECSKERIDAVEYGKITFIVQNGKLKRIDIMESMPTRLKK